MSKIKFSRYLVFISIFTFLAIFFFVVSQSYNNLIRSTEEIQDNPLIRSVSPDLEIDVIDEIEKRQELPPLNSQGNFPSPYLNEESTL